MPRKRVNSEREVSQSVSQTVPPENSHKKRRLDPIDTTTPSLPQAVAGSIKMDQNSGSKAPRRSARLQQVAPQVESLEQSTVSSTIPKKQQRARAKTLPTKPKEGKLKIAKRKLAVTEETTSTTTTSSFPKRRRRKSTSARRDEVPHLLPPIDFEDNRDDEETEVRDDDGVLWIKMPTVDPKDIYNFSAEFYIPPPRTVEVNASVGPPPMIVRLHIIDKKKGQEVPYDNDDGLYYWAAARILHEDNSVCVGPEFLNHSQSTETPMSWFHEEQEEDTRTPVTQTPPPGGPVRKWKTFVTFPNIQIPIVGRYRIMVILGVFVDQKFRTADGREKVEREQSELVTATSDVIVVQEEEPKDDDEDQTAELLEKKDLYDKLLAERDDYFRRHDGDDSF
ncbi:hypothetical protein ABW20_dc0102395 [Dactylellina cionopaga]|nr:hypothetical protein ABW20_dc0102395 [Dactylellina cionopaga]